MSASSPVSTQSRVLPEIQVLCSAAPYANYDILPHAHPAPQHDEPATVTSHWKILKPGYGSRHVHDVADFSLWDEAKESFRKPLRPEIEWILHFYKAREVAFFYPVMTIFTDTPPDPLPLTIARVAVQFLPTTAKISHPRVNTAYASPRVPDPVPFQVPRWRSPDNTQIGEIIKSLAPLAHVKAISWYGVFCFVELYTGDGRTYERHSLPGYVAGKSTTYHHSDTGLFRRTNRL